MIKHSLVLSLLFASFLAASGQPVRGTLRVHPDNPRYFTDDTGKAIYLTGSHTWENLQDMGLPGDKKFDYPEYLAMMKRHGHNFIRLWMFEQPRMASWTSDSIVIEPLPFARTGPGSAKDGKAKFDLTKFNQPYFERLRKRIMEAGRENIYVSVMLFQGWCLDRTNFGVGDPFPFLPYNATNNINGISAPYTTEDYDDKPSLHSLKISPQLLRVQEAYVKKVVETVNDLDNVLFEVINEGGATDWQYHMINFIKETERTMPKQHLVGMTHRGDQAQTNQALFDSPADWISPNATPIAWKHGDTTVMSSFKFNPPPSAGKKIIITDTDHLWGHGGDYKWVWKSFMRGLHPIFMDPWEPLPGKKDEDKTAGWFYDESGINKDDRDYPAYDLIRRNMGYTRRYALRVDLVHMIPRPELSSSGYCLANEGKSYLVYLPEGGRAILDLSKAKGEFALEWFIPATNTTVKSPLPMDGGGRINVEPPTSLDAVLYLEKN
ncbi:MAG TPA: DUF6298 domain-containing protein [Ohtaekwangia sp.]|nr:DUF6298 domain-containing protein [Ohtaekwangia sp.]